MRRWIVLIRPLVCWSLLMTFQNSPWMSMRRTVKTYNLVLLDAKEELELVARSIRQKLHDNSELSYKNFRILLGM